MPQRPKHQVKELEDLLKEAEDKGWTVTRRKRYFSMRCPCGKHQRGVHLTPSDPNYERNARGWLKRTGCWNGDAR